MRNNPFFSPTGLIMTILLMVVLGMTLWYSGGIAFSPGKLSALNKSAAMPGGFSSHAEFEAECQLCHQPLKTTQDTLCLTCHVRVEEQISAGNGTHAHLPEPNRCAACHQDHQGRDFDLTRSAYAHFDHIETNFSLAKHQVGYDTMPIDCLTCHTEEAGFPINQEGCVNCHASKDFDFMQTHSSDFGFECLLCHDGSDLMSDFDHQSTVFPLTGRHAQILCSACHSQTKTESQHTNDRENIFQVFRQAPSTCAACHQEPEMHAGIFTQSCNVCHSTQAWTPSTLEGKPFDHLTQAGFSLTHHQVDYGAQVITCKTCHLFNIYAFEIEQCSTCHEQGEEKSNFIHEHQDEFGPACLDCHDGVDRMRGFNHEERFPLQGKHAELPCQDCHTDRRFENTPSECLDCHAEPEIHAGYFGLKCQYCHEASSWSPAQLQIHNFPLSHGEQDGSDCTTCHLDTYTEYTCYTCHEHQPAPILESHLQAGITAEALPACADCHPGGELGSRP
ncbi:MAG: hypothetical protein JSV61_11815 [Anaerolineales bacterium]|nr:MAG: hypothetical protein JSV61_11815 [Anaerolineales bacterium]